MQTAQFSHPVPVICARAIERWASSAPYQNLLQQHSNDVKNAGKWCN